MPLNVVAAKHAVNGIANNAATANGIFPVNANVAANVANPTNTATRCCNTFFPDSQVKAPIYAENPKSIDISTGALSGTSADPLQSRTR